ncbi:MAG: peptidyl-tRNA hydrolase [Thermomicrobiales bacterium]
MSSEEGQVQYYAALRGQFGDSALALIAARGALLGQARWATRENYQRWRGIGMTKVALGADPEELAQLRAATGNHRPPRRRPRGRARRARRPARPATHDQSRRRADPRPPPPRLEAARPRLPDSSVIPVLLLVFAGDLGMHGGKLAAQAAHGVLRAESSYAAQPAWAEWEQSGAPIAIRKTNSDDLAALAEKYPGSAIRDADFTQIAAGSLTVVALPPGDPDIRSCCANSNPGEPRPSPRAKP